MRTIDVPEPADIIVSELLGSFGDNELSPECLDGAVRFLKRVSSLLSNLSGFMLTFPPASCPAFSPPADGISIPASYTAHLSPLASSKLYNEVTASTRDSKQAETPYVVMFQAVNTLSGDPSPESLRCGNKVQECWAFEHPRRDLVLDNRGLPLTNSHNTRSAQ